MNAILTAEELLAAMTRLPAGERVRFFTLLGQSTIEREDYTHAEVFHDALDSELTATEAAEYLEVSVSTLRRYVQGAKLNPARTVGRNQFFDPLELRAFKRILNTAKRRR